MPDEEFVKLKHWLDAELSTIHVYLAVILGAILDNGLAWTIIIIYTIVSIIYASAHINYVESKHKGYLRIPKR